MDHNGLPSHRPSHRPGRSQAPVHGVRTPGTPGRSRTPGTPATSRTPSSGGRTPATPGTPSTNRRNGRVGSLGNSTEKEKHVIQGSVSSPSPNNRIKHSLVPAKPSFSHDVLTSNKPLAQNASKSTASKWTAIYDYEAQGEVRALYLISINSLHLTVVLTG